jgi:hypothetical protein
VDVLLRLGKAPDLHQMFFAEKEYMVEDVELVLELFLFLKAALLK